MVPGLALEVLQGGTPLRQLNDLLLADTANHIGFFYLLFRIV